MTPGSAVRDQLGRGQQPAPGRDGEAEGGELLAAGVQQGRHGNVVDPAGGHRYEEVRDEVPIAGGVRDREVTSGTPGGRPACAEGRRARSARRPCPADGSSALRLPLYFGSVVSALRSAWARCQVGRPVKCSICWRHDTPITTTWASGAARKAGTTAFSPARRESW